MNNILSIFIGVSILTVAIAFFICLVIIRPAEKIANVPIQIANKTTDLGKYGIDKAANAFTAIFQSKVNIVSQSTICEATPMAELAVLKRNIREIIDYQRTDYGSTKRIVAEQTFIAKIGFDLSANFSASFDSSNEVIRINLPEPKILSLESLDASPKYHAEESGWINWIKTEDNHEVLERLKDQAYKSADSAIAISDAKQMIETRFCDLFQAANVKVIISFSKRPIIVE